MRPALAGREPGAGSLVRAALALALLLLQPWEAESTAHSHHLNVRSFTHHHGGPPGQAAAPAERRKLDIVIVHYDWERLQELRDAWEGFIAHEKVAALQPSVFIYCHNYDEAKAERLESLFQWGGGVVPVENAGREGSGYLEHILRHWHELAEHTLFSQDAPWPLLQTRFLKMFRNDTGFLPLAVYGDVKCDFADIVPTGIIQQIYAMLTHRLCPPEGWAAGFNGEFVVSRRRILHNRREIYEYLLDLLAAPSKHWLHETHDMSELKDRSNPMFGHVVERAWSLAFNCYEPSHFDGCWECNDSDCDRDNCQCFDQ